MIRILTMLSVGCLAAGITLLIFDRDNSAAIAIVLVLISFAISFLLGLRAGYHRVRGIVSDARAFVSGDIQQARLVSVSDPKGWLNPVSEVVLELEGEDGTVHSFDREVPIPFPAAWSYRLSKRFKLPLVGRADLSRLLAVEFRREGMDLSVGR